MKRSPVITLGLATAQQIASAFALLAVAISFVPRAHAQIGDCDEVIAVDTVAANDTGAEVAFCVELDFSVALRSDRFLDGVQITDMAEGCDFESVVFYPYFTFPNQGAVGPYRLASWEVNAQTFTADFDDVDELVTRLNALDPGGAWRNDTTSRNIVGGVDGSTYGPMEIVQTATQRRRVVASNVQAVANGALVSARGAGYHEYVIADPDSGCRDTLTIGLKPELDDLTDTVSTLVDETSRAFCVDNSGLIGAPQSPTFCHAGLAGTLAETSPYCFTYTPPAGFEGEEVACITVCDDSDLLGAPVCQTTRVTITTRRPVVPCDEGPFAVATDSIGDQGNPTAYCLPVSRDDFGAFDLTVDGRDYNGPLGDCDVRSSIFYNYAPLFDRGGSGPYTLFSWTVDGTFVNGNFQDPAALVDLMRANDPEGDWTLDSDNFNISGGDDGKSYSSLVIIHDATGTRSELLPNPIDTPLGTEVIFPGAGTYVLALTASATGCADSLVLTIGEELVDRPTDTIRVTSFGNSPFTACAELPFDGPYAPPTFCGTDGPYAPAAGRGSCIVIDPADGSDADGSICVEWCSAASPSDCQRVVFVIERVGGCAADPLSPDTLRLPAAFGSTAFCLGDGADLSDYDITVDGEAVAPAQSGDCGSVVGGGQSTTVYAYDVSAFGDNALRIDGWEANGTFVERLTVDDLAGLALAMSANDPEATWTYDSDLDVMLADTDEGNYTMLVLFDLVSNMGAPIALETRDIDLGGSFVPGAQLSLPGPGLYEVIVTDTGSGCVDRQVVIRDSPEPPTRDTIRRLVLGEELNGPFCLDTGELPGEPTSIESCGMPSAGAIAFTNERCYAYLPDPGFVGSDTTCVVICSGNGAVCDTTVIAFEVTAPPPPARPTRDTIAQDMRAGRLNGPYCLDVDELPSGPYRGSACGLPQNGTIDFEDGRCYTYEPDGAFVGVDTACVVVCAGDPAICDTTVIAINVIDAVDCDGVVALTPTDFMVSNCGLSARFEFSIGTLGADDVEIRLNGEPSSVRPEAGVVGLDLTVGNYTVVARDAVTGCATFFEVAVRCDESCAAPFARTDLLRFVDCGVGDSVLVVCLPTTLAALDSFDILLDGEPYGGRLRECGTRATRYYDIGRLGAGPYRVDAFRVDGEVFGGDAKDLRALADSLSAWDASAVWSLDVLNERLSGGSATAVYGSLDITELTTRQGRVLDLVTEGSSAGVAFDIPLGSPLRSLRFTKDSMTCLQDVSIELRCISSSEEDVVVEEGGDLLYCVDVAELNGPVATLEDACAGSEGAVALDFDEVLGCVSFRGIALGERRVCLVACDTLDVCDTTFVNVTTVEAGTNLGPEANDDDYRLRRGTIIIGNVLDNDVFSGTLSDVRIARQPQRGTATLGADGELTYVATVEECGFTDTLRYEICQAGVCDLATVTFRVRCDVVEVYKGFSPNGDGVNDVFVIEGIEAFPESQLSVYNRWGNEVYAAVGYGNDWAGVWEEATLTDGTYFYLLDLGGEEGIITGWVVLWR